MADQFGIDLGNALGKAEEITAARIRNRLSGNALDDELRKRKGRENALAGNSSPLAGLAIMDPAQANQVQSFLSNLKDEERETVRLNNERIGQVAAFVLNSDDKEGAYQRARAQAPEEMKALMPATLDENWALLQLARASKIDDIIKLGGKAGGSGLRSLKAADTNAIYRQAGGFYGGTFNANGDIIDLDPTTVNKVQAVAAKASEIYANNPNLSHAEAVETALKELGLWDGSNKPQSSGAGGDPLELGL